jgi:plastocyanin
VGRTVGKGWLLSFALWAGHAAAGQLVVAVDDGRGKPVADAVVMLRPLGAQAKPPAPHATRHTIDQRDLMFMPYLQVFRPGDEVVFRNSDATRHHVYSFSPARTFEFVLVPAQSSPPLRLDKPGSIAVGCNIHDQMIAYLYVTDAPWVVQTASSGRALFGSLPAGDYEVRVWQPRLRPGRVDPARTVSIATNATATLAVPLRLLPDPRAQAGREHVHY